MPLVVKEVKGMPRRTEKFSPGWGRAVREEGREETRGLMLKARPLCTGAELNLRDRVLGEVEKKSFIALPGKGGHSGLMPLKTVCPIPGDLVRNFIAMVQGQGC